MHIDSIEGYPLPIMLVRGWVDDETDPTIAVDLKNGSTAKPDFLFREPRPDVKSKIDCAGFIAEFHLASKPSRLSVDGQFYPIDHADLYCSALPHYGDLLITDHIHGRERIYGSGPPNDAAPEIVAVARSLPGPLLDFGCGNGDMIAQLNASGIESFGIEIDREEIRRTLKPSVAERVTLYDGSLPLPYQDGQFTSVLSSEVLEHVPHVERCAAEIARIAHQIIFVTVPDMSYIPLSHPTATVPWHLLEATHVNFFTTRSMVALFQGHFAPRNFFRFCNNTVNGGFIPGSLGIIFERK